MEPRLDSNEDTITDVEADPVEETKPSPWEGLGIRALSSLILAAIFLAATWQGGFLFNWLIVLAALMMAREWNALVEREPVTWRIGGLFYITIPCAALIWLRSVHFDGNPDAGRYLVLFTVLAVATCDIGAYFTGRQIGGPKLAPAISPGKTWAGLGGGVLASAVAGGIASSFTPYPESVFLCILLGALLAILAQAGDLFESWVKRHVGAKDSGTLIPGHGGLLDRVDGLTLTVPAFAWCVWLSGYVV